MIKNHYELYFGGFSGTKPFGAKRSARVMLKPTINTRICKARLSKSFAELQAAKEWADAQAEANAIKEAKKVLAAEAIIPLVLLD